MVIDYERLMQPSDSEPLSHEELVDLDLAYENHDVRPDWTPTRFGLLTDPHIVYAKTRTAELVKERSKEFIDSDIPSATLDLYNIVLMGQAYRRGIHIADSLRHVLECTYPEQYTVAKWHGAELDPPATSPFVTERISPFHRNLEEAARDGLATIPGRIILASVIDAPSDEIYKGTHLVRSYEPREEAEKVIAQIDPRAEWLRNTFTKRKGIQIGHVALNEIGGVESFEARSRLERVGFFTPHGQHSRAREVQSAIIRVDEASGVDREVASAVQRAYNPNVAPNHSLLKDETVRDYMQSVMGDNFELPSNVIPLTITGFLDRKPR